MAGVNLRVVVGRTKHLLHMYVGACEYICYVDLQENLGRVFASALVTAEHNHFILSKR